MNGPEPHPDDPPPLPRVYAALLHEAEHIAAKALDRVHELNDRYPAAVPAVPLAQLERGHADPAAERRKTIRLLGDPGRVEVRSGARPGSPMDAVIADRSPLGLSLRLPSPLPPGAVLGVRLPDPAGEAWCLAQVRHCHPDRDGWVVGCELTGDRPSV